MAGRGIRIPMYDQPRVELRGLPGARQRLAPGAEAFGAGIAEGAVKAVGAATMLAAKVVESQDAAILQEAWTQAVERRQQREQELAELKGQDAIGGGRGVQDSYQADLDEIAANLPADRHRERFVDISRKQALGMQDLVARHTGREADQLFEKSNASVKALADQEATLAAQDGDWRRLAEAKEAKLAAVEAYASHHGLDKDTKAAIALEATTSFHGGAIAAMVAADRWKDAQAYLEDHEDELMPAAVASVKQKIRSARARSDARTAADDILTAFQRTSFELDYDGAMAEAAKIEDADTRAAVESLVDQQMSRTRQARIANDEEPLARLEIAFIETGRFDRTSPDYEALSYSGKAQIAKMLAAQRRKKRGGGEEARQDRLDRIKVKEFKALSDADIRAVDIDSEYADVTRDGRADMKMHKRRVMNRGNVQSEQYQRWAEREAKRLGWRGDKAAEFIGDMMDKYWEYRDANDDANPPKSEVSKWYAHALQPGIEKDWLFDDEMTRWEAERAGELESWTPIEEQTSVPQGGEPKTPPQPAKPPLRWPDQPETARTIDDVSVDALVEVMRVWRGERPDVTPNERQILWIYNKLQGNPG